MRQRTHRVFAELTEFAVKLSEFSSPKQYSRNSIPPVSYSVSGKDESEAKGGGALPLIWREGEEGLRGQEAGWCTPGLGGRRGEGGGVNIFYRGRKRSTSKFAQLHFPNVQETPHARIFSILIFLHQPSSLPIFFLNLGTPATKIKYIQFCFRNVLPEKLHGSCIKYFSGINFLENAVHVNNICDSENYIEKLFGDYSLGKSHCGYIKICFRN